MGTHGRVIWITILGSFVPLLFSASVLRAERHLGDEWFRTDEPDQVVLELATYGGYGNGSATKWTLFGDGRVEETLLHPGLPRVDAKTRQLSLDGDYVEKLLRSLVDSGVAGATNESLLERTRAAHPGLVRFFETSDCQRTLITLNLIRRDPGGAGDQPVTTRLRFACIGDLPQLYPGVAPLAAVASVYIAFATASQVTLMSTTTTRLPSSTRGTAPRPR